MIDQHYIDWISAPSEAIFRASFEVIAPPISFVESSLGSTAYYLLKAADEGAKCDAEPIMIIHGGGTPALGMLALRSRAPKAKKFSYYSLFRPLGSWFVRLHLDKHIHLRW